MRSLIIKTFVRFLALWPLSVSQKLGWLLGLGLYHFSKKLRHITEVNIQLCWPELTTELRQLFVKQSLIHTGMTLMESGIMLFWPIPRLEQLIQSVDGEEVLQDAMAKQDGVIFLTPHLGCWELAGLYLGKRFASTHLYKPPKIDDLSDWLKQARERSGAKLVATDRLGARKLLTALKEKQAIGLLPDQEPPIDNGVFASFFGIQASTMTLAIKLSQKTGASIVFGFAKRLPHANGYQLIAMAADQAIYHDDLHTAVTAMNKQIEACIHLAPEQYQWSYKRFRRRPCQEKNPYSR